MTKKIHIGQLEVQVDRPRHDDWYLQVDGNDIISITDVMDDGTAIVTVHSSTHPNATTAWQGTVNVAAHLDDEKGESG
jgi:hypothetical protein